MGKLNLDPVYDLTTPLLLSGGSTDNVKSRSNTNKRHTQAKM